MGGDNRVVNWIKWQYVGVLHPRTLTDKWQNQKFCAIFGPTTKFYRLGMDIIHQTYFKLNYTQ